MHWTEITWRIRFFSFFVPRRSKYLLRRYLDAFLPLNSHSHEVLGPSGVVKIVAYVSSDSFIVIR